MKHHRKPQVFSIIFWSLVCTQWAFSQTSPQITGLENLYDSGKRVICQTENNNLCVSPANDIVMSLQGCATGSELPFPTFEINVPPGQDLTFYITRNPMAFHDSFFLVNQAVANTPPGILDICTESNPGIYTPPIPITAFDAGSIPLQTIPSAVVDQMAAESALNDFVVMIARDCDSSVEAFAGVRITRNPVSASPLTLTFEDGPLATIHANTNEFTFKVENMSNMAVNDLAFEIGQNFGNIGFISVAEDDGPEMPVTFVPFQKSFSLASNQFKRFKVKLTSYGIGFHGFYAQILSDFCENNGREDVIFQTAPNPALKNYIGSARTGDDAETELKITNPGSEPAEARLTGSDGNGRVMPLDDMISNRGFLGDSSVLQLAPGQSQTIRFKDSSMGAMNRFMVQISSDLPLLGIFRQFRRVQTRAGTRQTGTTSAMRGYNQAAQSPGQGVVASRIVAAENKKIVVYNYSLDPRPLTINVRDADTGNLLRQFTGTISEALGILTFPLVAGLDENAYIEIDGGPGVFAELEQCSANDFNVFKMRVKPSVSPRPEQGSFAGTTAFAQPFYQVPSLSISYGPSTYDMFVFPLTDQGITANSVQFHYDDNCGVNAGNSYLFLTPMAGANITFSITPNANTNLRGGFAFFDDPDTATSFRWIEGEDTFFMQAVEPVTGGRLYLPDVLLEGQVTPTLAPIRAQVYSDAAVPLSIAGFAADGTLLGLRELVLSAGAHILCDNDLDLPQGVAYLDLEIPGSHPSPFWFNALADEASLDYKDQLPLIPFEGDSVFTQIGNAIASWGEGGGPSCLGDDPDMMDLVGFVNNNYMCPPEP